MEKDLLYYIPRMGITFKTLSELTFKSNEELSVIIDEAIMAGKIIKKTDKYYKLEDLGLFLSTVVSVLENNFFARIIDEKDDVYVPAPEEGILIGDLVYLSFKKGNFFFYTLCVRRKTKYISTVYLEDNHYFLSVSKNPQLKFEVESKNVVLKDGDLVEAEIVKVYRRLVKLSFVKKHAESTDVGNDITAIILNYDCPIEFPDEVIAQVKKIPSYVLPEETKTRRNFTDELIVTIDGSDALDFDDAVSVKKTSEGYEIGIHIADVSHYVRANSDVDDEAQLRTTSIYVADRVVPMLPTHLSNGICSLNPGVERLTLSLLVKLSEQYKVVSSQVYEGVISSKYRLTYKEVNELLEKNIMGDMPGELVAMLRLLDTVTTSLRKDRKAAGALEIDSTELRFVLDKSGFPIDVEKRTQGKGERLIEDLMVLANVEIAKKMSEAKIPVLYRIHEDPPAKKMEVFIKECVRYKLRPKFTSVSVTPKELDQLLSSIDNIDVKRVISNQMLRSLAKARYDKNNVGHFGLALEFYAHFTSPIRRYPDLLLHRAVKDYLIHGESFDVNLRNGLMEHFGETTSNGERTATVIEREVDDLEAAKYMSKFVGKTFRGFISGMTEYAMYIELENGIEGMLRFQDYYDEYLIYNKESNIIISRSKAKVFYIGDKIEVRVGRVSIEKKQISFVCGKEPTYNNTGRTPFVKSKQSVQNSPRGKRYGKSSRR